MVTLTQRLDHMRQTRWPSFEQIIGLGIERESLRIDASGELANTPHSEALGHPLYHPWIQKDFSEAMVELVTPVFYDEKQLLNWLTGLHVYVQSELTKNNETLWPFSLPPALVPDEQIALAHFGDSHYGRMQTLYRHGLGLRYGRFMQLIAGVHMNLSFSDDFWNWYWKKESASQSLQAFKSQHYFSMLRNLKRVSWVMLLWFGASPRADYFDGGFKHATSMRMGEQGYANKHVAPTFVRTDMLEHYIQDIGDYTQKTYKPFKQLGVKDIHGEYQQVSDAIFQTPSEYYASVRAKAVPEKPGALLKTLAECGVEYLEWRVFDVNPFESIGVSLFQCQVVKLVFWWSLLKPSALINKRAARRIQKMMLLAASGGRDLQANKAMKKNLLKFLEELSEVSTWLSENGQGDYSDVIKKLRGRTFNTARWPSSKLFESDDLNRLGLELSLQHKAALSITNYQHKELLNDIDEATRVSSIAKPEQTAQSFEDYVASFNAL